MLEISRIDLIGRIGLTKPGLDILGAATRYEVDCVGKRPLIASVILGDQYPNIRNIVPLPDGIEDTENLVWFRCGFQVAPD